MANRRFVFLGHANPHDNPFTLWLGARLTAAGFDVWSDLRQLYGGETFWNDIEDGLRLHSAAYVPILSSSSVDRLRRGFFDELQMAVQIMRAPGMERFVLPVMIERVQLPPQLIQLNYIDFVEGWATGLSKLIAALVKAGVPQASELTPQAIGGWQGYQASAAGAAVEADEPERLSSNWFSLVSLPPRIRLLTSPVPNDVWIGALKNTGIPYADHTDGAFTFASRGHVQEQVGEDTPVRQSGEFSTEDFVAGNTGKQGPRIKAGDAHRLVTGMLNRGWEGFAGSRGLGRHQLSRSAAFFFPLHLLAYPSGEGHGSCLKRRSLGIRRSSWRSWCGLRCVGWRCVRGQS